MTKYGLFCGRSRTLNTTKHILRQRIQMQPPRTLAVAGRRYFSASQSPSSSSSLLDSAFGFVSSLRSKAAEALAASLPPNDRERLLEQLSGNKTKDESQQDDESTPKVHSSIAETIAAQKSYLKSLEELKAGKSKSSAAAKQDDAQLRAEAERAAEERVRTEVLSMTASTALNEHPVLGPVVADLGYKKIYSVSARTLSSIAVWKKQRTYRHARAKTMATDKMKTLSLGLPGVINIYESQDGSLSIIDGQHRIGMMSVLEEKLKSKKDANGDDGMIDLDNILVEVFSSDGDDDQTQELLFAEVNKAEPVKLVDLVSKPSHRKVIDAAATKLQEEFGEMFRPSQRCRPPHVNIDNLRDALFASGVVEKRGLTTSKKLYTWMIKQNDALAKAYAEESSALGGSVPLTALKKAKKFNFYLGLDSSWLYKTD